MQNQSIADFLRNFVISFAAIYFVNHKINKFRNQKLASIRAIVKIPRAVNLQIAKDTRFGADGNIKSLSIT